jgi:hypothetical protein
VSAVTNLQSVCGLEIALLTTANELVMSCVFKCAIYLITNPNVLNIVILHKIVTTYMRVNRKPCGDYFNIIPLFYNDFINYSSSANL